MTTKSVPVNLKAKPYYLDDEQIEWVKSTISSMSIEEKIGQLFINLTTNRDPRYLDLLCDKYHIGGVRWQGGTLEEIYEQNRYLQEKSRIPLLIAANCESGGSGAVKEGTTVATHAACGACQSTEVAREMGRVGGAEARAIGCNWTFAPISDLLINWRNTIVNTRAFGKDAQQVINMSKAYMAGMADNGIACCTKHFPGDGVDERDHHLLMGCNDLSCEEWDDSFGKVYRELIDEGIESFMVGHICLPAYSRKLKPGIKDSELMPASLAPELLNDLLRGQLGFNGLILTDASHMAGLTCAAPRSLQVPGAIAAGCDMFLFLNDMDEDFNYMLDGYKQGIISDERLNDALLRIVGLKAKVGLQHPEFPNKAGLDIVGCRQHLASAQKAADESITLVKDTQNLLPADPSKYKRVKLYFVESVPVSYLDGTDKAKQIFIEELENAGFDVTANTDYYEMEAESPSFMNRFKITDTEPHESFKRSYDLVIYVFHMKGYAKENNVRISWSASHSNEIPRYIKEVPTIGISLNYTNHLYDLPMMKTFINAYVPSREYIRACISKIIGKSPFKGRYDDNVWCGRWDTQL